MIIWGSTLGKNIKIMSRLEPIKPQFSAGPGLIYDGLNPPA